MARSFVLETVLKLRDNFAQAATRGFRTVEDAGDRAAKRIGGALAKGLSSSIVKVGGVLTGLGVGAALFKAGQGLQDVASGMAKVAKAAAAQELHPSFLAAITNALAAKGVDNFDAIPEATEEFFLRLTELQQRDPAGEIFGNLRDVGANDLIKQLRAVKEPTEALKLALSAIATEKDQAKKIRLADAFFGGGGLDLRRIATTREELGAVFQAQQELAGASDEQFEAAARLADAQAKLNTQWTAAKQAIASGLAPVVTEQIQKVTDWAKANRELINSRIQTFVTTVSDAIRRLISLPWSEYLQQVKRGFDVLSVAVQVAVKHGGQFLAVWATVKVAKIVRDVGRVGTEFLSVAKSIKQAGGVASSAGRLLNGALRFAGPIGAAITLADVLGTVIQELTGIEDFAARNTKADIGGLAGAKRSRAEGLQAETVLLERLVDTRGTGRDPGQLGHDPEIMQRFLQLVEETGSADAALEEARRRARANREAVRDLLAEADVVESEAERRVQERAERRAATQIQQVESPGGALLASLLPDLQATLARVGQAVETQTQALRDARFAPNTGAR